MDIFAVESARSFVEPTAVEGHPVLYATFEPGWRWSERAGVAGLVKPDRLQ